MHPTLDDRPEKYAGCLALALVATSAALAVHYAGAAIFNPDEAEKVLRALAPDASSALQNSRSVSHPPLVVMLAHAQSQGGVSELWLRLPSLLAMPLAGVWFYGWLRRLAGVPAAIAGLAFFVASPAALSAATEVREYGLLLAFTTAALLSAERMVSGGGLGWLVLHGLALAGGFLDHYSTAWVAVVIETYVLLELRRRGASYRRWLAWMAVQVSLVGLAAWTFFVHGTVFTAKVGIGTTDLFWVSRGFPQGESWWTFATTRLPQVFEFFAGGSVAGWLAIALYSVAVVAVVRGKLRPAVLVLIVLPLMLALALGMARLYPLAGMRQVTYLLPFVAAGVGIGAAVLVGQRLVPLAATAAVVTPIALWLAVPDQNPEWTARRNLDATLAALDEQWTPERPLFVDDAAGWQLRYYLRGQEKLQRMHYMEPRSWGMRAQNVMPQARTSAAALGLRGATELCILASGLGRHRPEPLQTHVPPGQLLAYHENGFFRLVCLRLKAGWRQFLPRPTG